MEQKKQKLKLLKLWEMLRNETDEEHPLTTNQLVDKLNEIDIPCDRRTLSKDIEMLNENGYEVMSVMSGHNKAYYTEDRRFSVPEVKILIDAVRAASFITEKKTKEFTEKLALLPGGPAGQILQENMVNFNTRKHSNELIYYTVDSLERAIRDRRRVTFRYFDFNERKEKVYRREGKFYEADPLALVFDDSNYYLVGFHPRHLDITIYRIDRIESLTETDTPVCDEAVAKMEESGVEKYTETVFRMYAGETRDITIGFSEDLIGVVLDRFGEETGLARLNEKEILASVRVQISPTFFGWLAQFCGEMRIVTPDDVKEQYRNHLLRQIEKEQ